MNERLKEVGVRGRVECITTGKAQETEGGYLDGTRIPLKAKYLELGCFTSVQCFEARSFEDIYNLQ